MQHRSALRSILMAAERQIGCENALVSLALHLFLEALLESKGLKVKIET